MTVRVKLFAMLRERAGTGDAFHELPEGSTVNDLWDKLRREHGGLSGVNLKLLYAVNSEYVVLAHRLADGDEVAFVPPVSGG
jgi:molybdopterin synthase catalytic subunit